MSTPTVVVVGGGVTGLVTAYRLRTSLGAGARIVILEQSDRLGGKLRTVPLAGDPVDVGAEAFIGRRPEMPALLDEARTAAGDLVESGVFDQPEYAPLKVRVLDRFGRLFDLPQSG